MKPTASMSDDSWKEIEELRSLAKAGDPAAQIEIVETLFEAINRGEISLQDGRGDAFRWVRTAEINPSLTDEQRVNLAVILFHHQPSPGALRTAMRLLVNVYNHGEEIVRGRAALTLGFVSRHAYLVDHFRQSDWSPFRNIPRSFVWFRRAARAGNAMAAIRLYENYLCGTGVLADEVKAHHWESRVQEIIGDPEKMLDLLSQRRSLAKIIYATHNNFESASEELFQAESEQSVFHAMTKLRHCAERGYAPAMVLWCAEILATKQTKGYVTAKSFLRDAVRQGCPAALALAGKWLLTGGRGVLQNIKLARNLLDRAAALGNANALALQCRCALEGLGEPRDSRKGWKLWKQAEKLATIQSDGDCFYELFCLRHGMEGIDAVHLLRLSAEAGNVQACLMLGRRYYQGWEVPADREEAQLWLQKAAFRHHSTAQFELEKLLHGKEPVPVLEKAMLAGSARAGIQLGILRMTRTPGVLQNWQEAERLFRRFCPLEPETGYADSIIEHFLAKPAAKRSERDRRFLDRARDYLRNNEPTRAARLFRSEDPDFAAGCEALEEKEIPQQGDCLDKWLKDLKTTIMGAESNWGAENKALRRRAGEELVNMARSLSCPLGRSNLRQARRTEHWPDVREMASRCYWRAVQFLLLGEEHVFRSDSRIDWRVVQFFLQEKDLTTDKKKAIDNWTRWALASYVKNSSVTTGLCPDFIREAAFFCCRDTKKTKELGLSFDTIVLGHEVAARRFDDKEALKWLVDNYPAPVYRGRFGEYLQKAVDAKIPSALRMKADMISKQSRFRRLPRERWQQEVVQLLREAAEGGDAEAQCRQGEMLLKDQSPKEWREQASEWFLKAAGKGHERAAMQLGKLLAEENSDEAIQWLEQVAEKPGADASLHTSAECELGKLYLLRRQAATAANHLRTAAQSNNRTAMTLLALEPGVRGALSDEEIRKWCLELLEHENAAASDEKDIRGQLLTCLGRVEKNKCKSADWFRQAAAAGDGPGTYEWARCLAFGDGCERDLDKADNWFQEAKKRCERKPDGNRDLAAQAASWHDCLFSIKSNPITPEHTVNMCKKLGLKGDWDGKRLVE